jgi:hypothetical protein
MSGDMISPVPAQRIDTLVADPETGEQRRRTDYSGTVWYGGRPQMTGGMVMGGGGLAQITTPFWVPDSHKYGPGAATTVQIQASAAVQSAARDGQILDVSAGLGEDPQDGGALLAYVAITAVASLPLGVAYRVTVICAPEALRPPAA